MHGSGDMDIDFTLKTGNKIHRRKPYGKERRLIDAFTAAVATNPYEYVDVTVQMSKKAAARKKTVRGEAGWFYLRPDYGYVDVYGGAMTYASQRHATLGHELAHLLVKRDKVLLADFENRAKSYSDRARYARLFEERYCDSWAGDILGIYIVPSNCSISRCDQKQLDAHMEIGRVYQRHPKMRMPILKMLEDWTLLYSDIADRLRDTPK